jgi:hypothetical protein
MGAEADSRVGDAESSVMDGVTRLAIVSFCALALWPWEAGAVSQFSRKYSEPCSTCHSIFPRVNYYGERYLRNGYQKPDSEEGDGDRIGKKQIGDELVLGKVEDWLGARLNVSPFKAKTNAITVNGEPETQYTVGNPEWLQFFVAGSIYKDVSIFIESEFTNSAFKFNWYYLGFHNLAGDAVNFQVGNVSPLLFASYQNRLPLFPMVRNEAMRIKSSYGYGTPTEAVGTQSQNIKSQPEDALDTSSARPGIQYYGEGGPIVWWAGVSPGKSSADVNNLLHYWAGLRFEVVEDRESALEGSSVSIHYQRGTDARNSSSVQIKNDYSRLVPSLNLRLGGLDLQAGYVLGKEDNTTLAAVPAKGEFDGYTVLAAYVGDSRWIPGIEWDVTREKIAFPLATGANKGFPTEMKRLTPNLTYMIRENMRVTAYAAIDLLDTPAHPDAQHEFIINLRAMF